MSWQLDSSTEGWTSSDATLGNGTIGGRTGIRALLDVTKSAAIVRVAFCQPQNLINKSFHAWIRYDGPATDLIATGWLNEGSAGGGSLALTFLETGVWHEMSFTFADGFVTHTELLDAATHVGINLMTQGASGSLYIDSLTIQ